MGKPSISAALAVISIGFKREKWEAGKQELRMRRLDVKGRYINGLEKLKGRSVGVKSDCEQENKLGLIQMQQGFKN